MHITDYSRAHAVWTKTPSRLSTQASIRTILPWDKDRVCRRVYSSKGDISQSEVSEVIQISAHDPEPADFSVCAVAPCGFHYGANSSIMPHTCTRHHKRTPLFCYRHRSDATLPCYTCTLWFNMKSTVSVRVQNEFFFILDLWVMKWNALVLQNPLGIHLEVKMAWNTINENERHFASSTPNNNELFKKSKCTAILSPEL